jgi:hypothetical protein
VHRWSDGKKKGWKPLSSKKKTIKYRSKREMKKTDTQFLNLAKQ